MDVFPKFIIETDDELGDCLIIAKCTYHKQLVTDKTKVKGGGWWSRDNDTNTFILHGDSGDFGRAKFEDIQKCVQSGNVYTNPYVTHSIANKHNFVYKDECGEITDLK
jgi:hypothetical protein